MTTETAEKKQQSTVMAVAYNVISRLLLVGIGIAIGAVSTSPTSIYYKRDNTADNNNDNKDSASSIVKKILNNTAFRVAVVFLAILLINMVAICIHHIYHRVTTNSKSYRNIERVISPF